MKRINFLSADQQLSKIDKYKTKYYILLKQFELQTTSDTGWKHKD